LLFLLLLGLVFVSSQQRPHVFNTSTIVFWPERWSIMFVGKWEGPRHLWLVRAAVRAMAAVTRHRCQRHRRGCLPLIVGAVVFVLLLLLMILSSLCLLLLLLSELIYVYVRSQQRRELFQTATVVFRRQRWSTMVIGRGAWGGEEEEVVLDQMQQQTSILVGGRVSTVGRGRLAFF
jgi:hypothetical protein